MHIMIDYYTMCDDVTQSLTMQNTCTWAHDIYYTYTHLQVKVTFPILYVIGAGNVTFPLLCHNVLIHVE